MKKETQNTKNIKSKFDKIAISTLFLFAASLPPIGAAIGVACAAENKTTRIVAAATAVIYAMVVLKQAANLIINCDELENDFKAKQGEINSLRRQLKELQK